MGKKNKIIKSIESFEKRIKEHEDKIQEYKKTDGRNYTLIAYWEKEKEQFRKQIEEKKKKFK